MWTYIWITKISWNEALGAKMEGSLLFSVHFIKLSVKFFYNNSSCSNENIFHFYYLTHKKLLILSHEFLPQDQMFIWDQTIIRPWQTRPVVQHPWSAGSNSWKFEWNITWFLHCEAGEIQAMKVWTSSKGWSV